MSRARFCLCWPALTPLFRLQKSLYLPPSCLPHLCCPPSRLQTPRPISMPRMRVHVKTLFSVPGMRPKSCAPFQICGRKDCGRPVGYPRSRNLPDQRPIGIICWRKCSGWLRTLPMRGDGRWVPQRSYVGLYISTIRSMRYCK